jgi:uridine kinase
MWKNGVFFFILFVMQRRVLIGIAGGTGSGKTTVAQRISEFLGDDKVLIIPQDAYYKDRSYLPIEERDKLNFDHPDAFDTDLLEEHLEKLKSGQPVEMPIYNYKLHIREKETRFVEPKEVIVIEGILVLHEERLRRLMDIKIYVDTPDDIRFIRRLERDMRERGRTLESVINQYMETVRPMHEQFVEPSKRYADIIIPEGGFNDIAIEMVTSTITQRLLSTTS